MASAEAVRGELSGILEDVEAERARALRHALAARLCSGPEPLRGARGACTVLGSQPAEGQRALAAADPELVARILAALCGVAPFFAPLLERHPEWLPKLIAEDYDRPLPPAELGKRLASARSRENADPAAWLRRFKYYELARITARDASPEWLPIERSGETLHELSALADALLDEALGIAGAEIAEACGPPRWRDQRGEAHELGLCVLGLGKLGASELNYSSDVDLVYVHDLPPDATELTGPSELSPLQYFTRVAQRFGRLVSDRTPDGFLYRIDLDLRPRGAQGALVISSPALEQYYESWAETWEKAAFMKARPVAGDTRLGWRSVRAVGPALYRSAMDYTAVRGIRNLKDKIEQSRTRRDDGFDVKVGVGGIRDIEFVVQALQLLHGGRILQLRERSTQRSLEQLGSLGLLPADDARELLSGYCFLRRLENRLQMESEQQTHLLRAEGERRLRAARAMGVRGDDEAVLGEFDSTLGAHRAKARSMFERLLPEGGRKRLLELFERGAPQLCAFPTTRTMLESLADHFASEIDARPDPERALNNLDRFVQGVGQRAFYYELLLDRPELVARLTALFDASNYLSSILASHPRLIEPVFSDPNVLLFSRAALEEDLEGLVASSRAAAGDPTEGTLEALRLFHHRHVLNIGLLDLAGRVDANEVESALSDVAEVCLAGALGLSDEQLAARRRELAAAERTRFLVVAMGKLATRELSYGSDLDLIFLLDVDDGSDSERLEATDFCVRLTQRLIGALQTRTAEGSCYEIDARLRPSGNQGTLVTSLPAFERYHRTGAGRSAEAWERQALLRARPVAGDFELGRRFETLRREVLAAAPTQGLATDIHRIRMRMEQELAQETHGRYDFKTGRGGVLDVESIVQLHQLRLGREYPDLYTAEPLALHLERLAARGQISDAHARILRGGWDFLKTLSSRLRIVENRSISELDEERGDLEGLALRMGYETVGREGSARRALLRDYVHHTEAIRGVYNEIFEGGTEDAPV